MPLSVPGTQGVLALQTNFYVTRMKDLLDESLVKVKGCRKHGNKELSYFCASCEVPVCPDCCVTEHKDNEGHSTAILGIAREEQVRMLDTELTEAKEHLLFNKDCLHKLEAELRLMGSAKNRALQDIRQEFQTVHKLLEERQKELESAVQQAHKEKSETVQSCITDFMKEDNAVEGLLDQCAEAKHNGAISDVMAYKAKLMHKNRYIREIQETFSDSLKEPWQNYIQFDSKHNMQELLSSVQHYGHVVANKKIPCKVKLNEYHRIIAGLFTSMSFTLHGFTDEPLDQMSDIDVEIRDINDDKLSCLVNELGSGRYEITFRPAVSGIHHARVTLCTTGIVSEFPLHVHSNNPSSIIGSYGCLEGQVVYPRALAVDRHNNIFVVDTGNNRIQKFDKNGQFLLEFPIAAENESISSCGIALDHVRNMLVCPEVNVHEADLTHSDAILFYTMDGILKKRLAMSDFLKKGLSVAVNSMGQTIIADSQLNAIFILDKHGRVAHRFGEKGSGCGQFYNPTFVCVDEKDHIIVSDCENNRIQVFDRTGNYRLQFGGKGTGKGQFTNMLHYMSSSVYTPQQLVSSFTDNI